MKKLLMALAACATTLIASAAIKSQEGFEGKTVGKKDLGYFSGTGGSIAAYGDVSAPADQNYPFSGSTNAQYCEVDADETDSLVNTNGVGATYFDMYVQFPADASTPSPDIDDQAKIAVYVNSSSNVVVVAGDGNGGYTNITTGATIVPGEWARLTIAKVIVENVVKYDVYIKENKVQGSPFIAINTGDPTTAAFTGVGKIDNYVARTTDPFFARTTEVVGIGGETGGEYFTEVSNDAIAAAAAANLPLTLYGDADFTATLNAGDSFTLIKGEHGLAGFDASKYAVNGNTYTRVAVWSDYLGEAVAGAYEIDDLDELKKFQENVGQLVTVGETFKLTADIELDAPWPGIGLQNGKDVVGTVAYTNGAFRGTFDGQNHTISNYKMSGGNLDYGGFFNSVLGATIRNMKISFEDGATQFAADTSSTSTESGATFVGVSQNSTLEYLETIAAANVINCGKGVGGIVGYLADDSVVQYCTNNVAFHSYSNKVGGIAMIRQNRSPCVIRGCRNTAMVSTGSGKDEFGAIVGYVAHGLTIEDCENTANVKLLHHQQDVLSISGVNKGHASARSYTGVATPGLNFATVDGDVATFVADDALALDGEYKVMSARAAATYNFDAAGTIAFDTAVATPASTNITAVASLGVAGPKVNGSVSTYSAGIAAVDDFAYATFADAIEHRSGEEDVVTLLANASTAVLDSEGKLKVMKNGYNCTVLPGETYVISYRSDGVVTTYTALPRVAHIIKPDTSIINYASLHDAITASISGDDVFLDADDISDGVTLPPGVRFSTNGKTYSGTVTAAYPNLYDINSETVDDTTIYTVVGGTAVASITKEEVKTDYNTIAKALAAAETDDTVVLEDDSAEDVSLPTGVSFATNGHAYSGTVSAAENGYVAVVDENGVYTAFDNTATVWVGSAGNNNWTDGGNWSTGCAPTDYTDVTIPSENVPEGGWLIYVGGNAKSKSIALLGDTTIQRDADITHNGCLNVQESITTGATPSTLTLNSAFIFAGDSEVSISCPIVCANGNSAKTSGFTSNSTGTFNISGAISGTGTLEFRKAVTLSQDLTVASDGLSAKFEAQPTFSNGAVLKGDGTVVWTVEPGSEVQTMLQDSANWTGICELVNVAKNSLRFQDYGNLESTVRLNGVTGYMAFPGNTTPQNDATVKVLDIAAGGLTLNNAFHSRTVVFDATKITGSGPIKVGTQSNVTSADTVTKYVFTGDMREFTGALNFGTLSSYRPTIIIATSSSNLPTPSDYGQIIVAEGATAYVNNTWTAPGAMVVIGDVVMGAYGSITGDNGVAGSGTITVSTSSTPAPAFRSEPFTSVIGTIPVWTGTTILAFTPSSGSSSQFNTFGTDKSSVGTATAFSGHLGGNYSMVPTLNLVSDFTFNNGSSTETEWEAGKITTLSGITGKNNLNFTWVNPNTGRYAYYTIGKIDADGFEGSVSVANKNALAIGAVEFAAEPAKETCLVKMSVASGGKIYNINGDTTNEVTVGSILTTATVGGAASETKLVLETDGLFVAVASVTANEVTTYYSTLEAAGQAALAADDHVFTVLDGTTSFAGWEYDSNAKTFTKLDIAQVGETKYLTLAAAIATGTTDDIVLINDCAETVTLGAGQTIKPGSYAFSGVLKGAGTIYYAAKPTTVPTFEDWTGTFVADWDGAHGTPFPANDYGILGSVVEVRKLGGGYVPLPGSENVDRTVLPTISIPDGCYMKLANGYTGTKTVFTKVTGVGAMTNNTYTVEIATLENFTGSISSDVGTKIVDVVTSTTAAPGACLVKGGSFTDVASMTVNGAAPTYKLEYKDDVEQPGIYYAVAATISDGESVSNCSTVAEALSYAFIRRPSSFGWVVTVLDDEWEDEGTYDEFFTWDPVARTYTVITYPARIGMNHYPSLAAAVSAAQSGDTIVLIADDRVSFTTDNLEIGIDKALTIEGNGYTVYGVSDYAGGAGDHDIYISGSGDVTIKNVTLADFAGDVANNMRTYPIWTGSAYAGTLTLDNVTVQDFNRTAFNLNGGTVVVTNCTITCDSTRDFQEGIGAYLANVTIADTTITGAGSSNENWPKAACIQLGNPNGTVAGTGSITVLSGTFAGQYGIIVASNAQNNVSVQGGNFTGSLLDEEGEAGTISITGGTFSVDPSDYVASGYEAKASAGVWTVAEKSSAPLEPGQSSSETYTTPEAAQDAAESVEIAVPTAVADELDSAAQATYKAMFEAKVVPNGEGGYKVEVALTSAAEEDLQAQANADAAEVVEDLTEAEVTLTTTPGLYYSFEYGTSLQNMTEGARTLATGEKLELARPTTENATSGFYRVLVNVTDK